MFSDSYSFYINDYKTVYFEEYESCPNIHSDYDITDNCNMDYCKEIAKISLAMLVNSSSSITHIENFEESIITMNVYPNPTKGKITIKAESAKCIEVINIEGKQVYIGNENEIDLSLQPKGIYIIKVITDKQTINKKIIKL
jgi:hypothetical protein